MTTRETSGGAHPGDETPGEETPPPDVTAAIDPARVKAMEIVAQLRAAHERAFHFLLVGRAGMGKSSLVNSLLGREVAPVGHYEPTTADVAVYETTIEGVTCKVADTPGLCDDLPEAENDERYLEMIRVRVPSVDCMWFVTRLDEHRVRMDEKRGIQMITAAFGPRVWERAVLVFTFANNVAPDQYSRVLARRAELIRAEVAAHTGTAIARAVPVVAADNHADTTPDGRSWLGELYTTVFERISASGALPFLLATAPRVSAPAGAVERSDGGATRITLDDGQRDRIIRRIDADVIPELGLLGAAVGAAFGPVGAAVGGVVGIAVGLLAWLRN
jgi:hypothetical protein